MSSVLASAAIVIENSRKVEARVYRGFMTPHFPVHVASCEIVTLALAPGNESTTDYLLPIGLYAVHIRFTNVAQELVCGF